MRLKRRPAAGLYELVDGFQTNPSAVEASSNIRLWVSTACSRRTLVRLKLHTGIGDATVGVSSRRTLVRLKLRQEVDVLLTCQGSRRTLVRLKHEATMSGESTDRVPDEP